MEGAASFQRHGRRIRLASLFSQCLMVAAAWSLASTSSTWAADGIWTSSLSGSWSVSTNWLDSIVADGADSTATFQFDGTPGIAVTLDGPRTIGNLVFPSFAGTIDNGGNVNNALTLAGAATPIIDVGSGCPEISAVISGMVGFSKQNSGCLYLSAANTYWGTTFIDGGGLEIASDASLGHSNAIVFGNTGNVLQAGTADVLVAANRTITLGVPEVSFDSYGNHLAIAATIDGPGSLHKTDSVGESTMTLTGSNSYQGDTFIDSGVLSINSNAALGGPNGRLRIPSTASLRIDFDVVLPATRTVMLGDDGTATFDTAGHNLTISGSINTDSDYGGTGTATFLKTGPGTLTLNGSSANGYLGIGTITVNGGTLLLDFANLATPTDLIHNAVPDVPLVALNLGSSTLKIKGKSSGNTSQTLGDVTQNAGSGQILLDPNGGGSTTLNLGALNASTVGVTLLVGKASGAGTGTLTITTTSTKDSTGIYGGRVVYFDGTNYNWATTTSGISPYTLSAYAGYTALTTTSGTDTGNSRITPTSNTTLGGSRTTNSLKVENPTSGRSLRLVDYSLTLTSGGLLLTGTNAFTISGNTGATRLMGSDSGDLLIHQYNTGGLTISAVIGDNGGTTALTKAGPGPLVLSGANTYTGGTYLNGGVTRANRAETAGTSGPLGQSGDIYFGGGTLQYSPSTSIAIYDYSSRFSTADGQNYSIDTNGRSVTFASPLTGVGGALTKLNSGTLTLSGQNTYTGGTTVSGGTLALGVGDDRLPVTTVLTLGDGTSSGKLMLSNGTTARNQTLAGLLTAGNGTANAVVGGGTTISTLTLNIASSDSYGGLLGGGSNENNLALTKTGDGTLTLGGTSTYTGVTSVNAGTLQFAKTSALYNSSSASWTASNIKVASNATLALSVGASGGLFTASNIKTLAGLGTATGGFASGSLLGLDTTNAGGNFTYSDVIANPNGGGNAIGLTKMGTGSLTLSGSNTYSGVTAIDAGTLMLGAANVIPDGPAKGNVNVLGALDLNTHSETINGLFGTGTVDTLAGSTPTLTVGNNNQDGAFSGGLKNTAGTLALTKAGNGTQTLSGSNTYSGVTTVNAGTLRFANESALYNSNPARWTASSIVVANNAALALNVGESGGLFTASDIGIIAGIGTATGGFANGSTLALDTTDTGGSFICSAAIANPNTLGLTKLGPGSLTLSGTNTYTGKTLIHNGTLHFANESALYNNTPASWTASKITIAGGTTLKLSVGDSGGLFTSSDIGIIAGMGTATGGFANGSTLALDTTNAGGSFNCSAAIANPNGGNNTLGLTKVGTGSLTLSGTNTYTGRTLIDSGTLHFARKSALYNNTPANWTASNITIAGGATLALSVGESEGLFNESDIAKIASLAGIFTADTGFTSHSFLGMDTTNSGGNFTYSNAIANPYYGEAPLGLTKLGTGILTLSGQNTYTGGTIVNAGTLAVTTSTALPDGYSLTVGAGGTLIFDPSYGFSPIVASAASSAVSPVPEPSTLVLLIAGLAVGLGAWRRRK